MRTIRLTHALATTSLALVCALLPPATKACLLNSHAANPDQSPSQLSLQADSIGTPDPASNSDSQNARCKFMLETLMGNWHLLRDTPFRTLHSGEMLSFDRKGSFVHTRYDRYVTGGNQVSIGYTDMSFDDSGNLVAELSESEHTLSEQTGISATSAEGNFFGGQVALLGNDHVYVAVPGEKAGDASKNYHFRRLHNIKDTPLGAWMLDDSSPATSSPNTCTLGPHGKPDFGIGTHCTFLYIFDDLFLTVHLQSGPIKTTGLPSNGVFVARMLRKEDDITLFPIYAKGLEQRFDEPLPLNFNLIDSQRHDKLRRMLSSANPDEPFNLARLLSHKERKGVFRYQ